MIFQKFRLIRYPKLFKEFLGDIVHNKRATSSYKLRFYMFFLSQGQVNDIFSEIEKNIDALEKNQRDEISKYLDILNLLLVSGFAPVESEEKPGLFSHFFFLALENCHKDLTNYFVEKEQTKNIFKKYNKKLKAFPKMMIKKMLKFCSEENYFEIPSKKKIFSIYDFFFFLENDTNTGLSQDYSVKFTPLTIAILNKEPNFEKKIDFIKFILGKNVSIYAGVRINSANASENISNISNLELAVIMQDKVILKTLIDQFSAKLSNNSHIDRSTELDISNVIRGCEEAFRVSLQQNDDISAEILCNFALFIEKNIKLGNKIVNLDPQSIRLAKNIFENFLKIFTEEKSEKIFVLDFIKRHLNTYSLGMTATSTKSANLPNYFSTSAFNYIDLP